MGNEFSVSDGIRLQKFLAQAGVASRRKSEELILQGRVSMNGRVVTDMGVKVSGGDLVELDGKSLCPAEKKVYIMVNKPIGYVSTVKDQFGRKTVIDLLHGVKERVYPVGRLDFDTSGLLLLTNDGDFAFRLTHPKHELKKVYRVRVTGQPDMKAVEAFQNGIQIEDYVTAPAILKILDVGKKFTTLEISIHEGRNRQVRKMCEAIGHPVENLKRISIGGLGLSGLEEGDWRYLSQQEMKMLYPVKFNK